MNTPTAPMGDSNERREFTGFSPEHLLTEVVTMTSDSGEPPPAGALRPGYRRKNVRTVKDPVTGCITCTATDEQVPRVLFPLRPAH